MAIAMARRRLPLRTVRLLMWGLPSIRRSPGHHPSRSSVVGYATATFEQLSQMIDSILQNLPKPNYSEYSKSVQYQQMAK